MIKYLNMNKPPSADHPAEIKRRGLKIKVMFPGGETALGKALKVAIDTKDQKTRECIEYITLG